MKSVYILHHSYELEECEETKLIGVYTSNEEAELAISRLKDKNGFKYKPEGFEISEYKLNKDHWTEGFVTLKNIFVKNINNEWIVVESKCLPDNQYQIFEPYENESLGEFKHLDIVECEKTENGYFAIKRVN